jgi:hypothetical protein
MTLASAACANCSDPIDGLCPALAQASTPSVETLQSPLAALQSYLRKRGLDPNSLTVADTVDVMLDWYRLAPMGGPSEDQLVFRYGGWSEGCATAFKLSLLRRVAPGADGAERLAGITVMFEPSGQGELAQFAAQSGETASLEAFVAVIKNSPAYKKLGNATPMAVMVEAGGVR